MDWRFTLQQFTVRNLWNLELSLVIEVTFTTNRLFLIENLQLIVKSLPLDRLGKVPQEFPLEQFDS